MKTHQITAVASLLALAAVSPLANASITSVTGATTLLGSAPVACGPGALTGFTAFAWDEQANVPVSSLLVDMTNNAGSSTAPVPGFLSGNVDSHFIHFEPIPGVIGAVGTVTFNSSIIGVDFRALSLDSTDILLGATGTTYPTGYPFRGITTSSPSFFTISGNTLSFTINVMAPSVDVVQFRVLTHSVPGPGPAALAALGGLVALRRRRHA